MEENQQYKLSVFDKQYSEYYYTNIYTNAIIESEGTIDPAQSRLFSGDIFVLDSNKKVHILESPLRSKSYVAGVLMIHDGRTYGRTSNQKRLLYKCVPDDNQYPAFLIPYELKQGFSKYVQNKYVLFKFVEWSEKSKHPHGILTEVLGDVGDLKTYYEYRIYCKNLFVSFRQLTTEFSNKRVEKLDIEKIQRKYYLDSRKNKYTFTIDPPKSVDYDDAFSINEVNNNVYKVSVHISNVAMVLEHFNLWAYLSEKVATIYLPDQPRHMLPLSFSQKVCSLIKNEERVCLSMDVYFDMESKKITHTDFTHTLICVDRNYMYEEPELLNNDNYKKLLKVSKELDSTITTSNEVVAFWMMKMNIVCGQKLALYKTGIFKTLCLKTSKAVPQEFSSEVRNVIQNWNNVSSKYELFGGNILHQIMDVEYYCHITSPIRRIVDIVNQLLFMKYLKNIENLSENSEDFYQKWLYKIEFINVSMKNIRKIQNDCILLDRVENNPEILEKYYRGIVFDRKHKHQTTYSHMVFIEDLNVLLQLNTSKNIENYQTHIFKLFMFEDEYNIKRKIRLQLIE